MALDDYFADPSQDCLAQLFDAINSMDLSAAPVLTRREKLVMRSSERNNIFLEKFSHLVSHQSWGHAGSRGTKKDLETPLPALPSLTQCSPSDASFSLGGSAVWVGDETALEAASVGSLIGGSTRYRKSSSSSSNAHGGKELAHHPPNQQPFIDPLLRHGVVKDTHFYHTTVPYKDHHLPIRMPLSTFPEEVGDVCDHLSTRTLCFAKKGFFLVFTHHVDQGVFIAPTPHRSCTPTFAHQRISNASNNRVVQCARNRETYHLFGS